MTYLRSRRNRTVIALIIVMLAVVAGAGLMQAHIETSLRGELKKSLDTVLSASQQALRIWAQEERESVAIWARDPDIIDATRALAEAYQRGENLLQHPVQETLRRKLTSVLEAGEYKGYFIISPELISLASTRVSNIGSTNLLVGQPEFLQRLQQGTSLSLPLPSDVPLLDESGQLIAQRPTMFAGAPIYDHNELLGYFTFRLNPTDEFTSILQRGRIGNSGETYAFNRDGLLISESRFDEQLRAIGMLEEGQSSILNLYIRDPGHNLLEASNHTQRQDLPLTVMAASATRNQADHNLDGYRDYRGVPVVGAWLWDAELNLGITTEVDVTEAYATLFTLRYMTLGATLVLIALIVLLSVLFLNFNAELEQRVTSRTRQLDFHLKLLNTISQAQTQFIGSNDIKEAFELMLNGLLQLADSEYGFIGEVLHKDDKTPYLKTYAITNIAWNEETRRFYAENAPKGLEFYNLNSLFGTAITSGDPVIANDPAHDPRRTGIPEGHPPLNAFLALPIYSGNTMLGLAGIANRPGGYDQQVIDSLQPFLTTCANLINAYNSQRAARETEERMRLLLDSASEGIYGLDTEGRAMFANPAACAMVGYSQEEILGKPMHDLIHYSYADGSTYPREDCHMFAAIQSGEVKHISNEVLWRKDGSCFPVEYTSTPILKEGEVVGAVIIFTDISERQKIDLLKREFVSAVSHELRTPLTAIQGSLKLLHSNVLTQLPAQAGDLMNIAISNSERLLTLINDILDIEKLEAGKVQFRFEDIELMPLLEEAVANNRTFADKYQTCFNITQRTNGIILNTDRDRLMQVLTNLMSNAAKFSPPGQAVEIAASCHEHIVRISVTDHGPGIPLDFQERMFEKFTQADSSDRRQVGGTGLGLSISRAIIERLGGRIDFTTAPDSGTTFYIELASRRH